MATKPTPPKRGPGAAPKTSRIRSTNASRIEDRRTTAQRDLSREVQSQGGPVNLPKPPPRKPVPVAAKRAYPRLPPGPRRPVPVSRGPLRVNPSTGATSRAGRKKS